MDSTTQLPPFKLAPYFQTRIWGFDDLAPWFDHQAAPGEPIGEVWLTGAKCTVANGPFAGQNFASAVAEHAHTILGAAFAGEAEYPLLIKVLFPREKLSVQVHPDDALAQQKGEPRGKTECWYALDAKPDAKVALGLKPGVTPEAVRAAIEDKSLEDLLGWLPLHTGDMVYVDAGTVHAIWPGSVILETQQTSDTTYRLYDYGRPRELHVDASLEAMRVETGAGKIEAKAGARGETILVDEQYFRVERWDGDAAGLSAAALAEGGPQLLFVAGGTLRIEPAGITPQAFEPFTLGRCELAVVPASTIPWEARGEGTVMRIVPQGAPENAGSLLEGALG
jgi:mannose-6-phosphate isomerase